jgi:hypothetical protein
MRFVLALVALGLATVGAIYPDDHWSRVTKMTTDNFDEVVKREVDAGRTLFVRWIASPG